MNETQRDKLWKNNTYGTDQVNKQEVKGKRTNSIQKQSIID